jgi:hypothetical protein
MRADPPNPWKRAMELAVEKLEFEVKHLLRLYHDPRRRGGYDTPESAAIFSKYDIANDMLMIVKRCAGAAKGAERRAAGKSRPADDDRIDWYEVQLGDGWGYPATIEISGDAACGSLANGHRYYAGAGQWRRIKIEPGEKPRLPIDT